MAHRNIQSQLILYFTIAILVPSITTTIIGITLLYDQVITRAETRSISDLNSAREIYQNRVSQIESVTRLTSVRSLIVKALVDNNRSFLKQDLEKTLRRERLDVLTIVDKNGTVVARGRNPAAFGDNVAADNFVDRVLKTRQMVTGTDIVSRDALMKESSELAAQALMEITPTPRAKARDVREETSGMMMKAAAPIFDDANNFVGILLGGTLLNRNYDLVDKVKEILYEGEIYKGKETGTATIFQNDLRISTNVKNEDGTRAITTLVSEEVYDAIMGTGKRWVGEAFVVNAWYITAYEPIRDINRNIIGILYVGILKQPFDDILGNTLMVYLGIALGGIILIIMVAVRQAKRISTPLKKLDEAANRIAEGDFRQDVSVNAPQEIAHLASSLNKMARDLEREKHELEQWTTTLEKKVEERTNEIKKIHSQLFRSEKLASLGKLAAGVAHEINNPLTGILTNSSLMLEDLDREDPRRDDVDVIVKETIRCREIVKRLLDFARQTKPQKKLTNINSLIDNIVLLVRNQTSFRNIQIERRLRNDLPEIMADTDQIQQVFVNFILNASEAMTQGGNLVITSELSSDNNELLIQFADTGPGIPDNIKEQIFDPFFTTKESGTGLGLSISYGIIEQHGGTITLDSVVGKGSTFTVHLPALSAEYD